MNLHFIGLIITLYFGTYFLVHSLVTKKLKNLIPDFSDIIKGTFKKYIMGAKWTDKGKYLSSQKSAFLVFALLGAGIIVTGSIKTVAYYWGVPFKVTQIVTQSHDIIAGLFVLMLVVHIIFVVSIPSHRRLLKSLFTGNFK